MGTFHTTVDISRPPDEVFAFVAEPHKMPLWYDAVDHVARTTNGPSGPGARYDVTRSLPGGQVHNDVELTDHQPDRLVTLESLSGPTPFRYRYTLEPTSQGTRLLSTDQSAAPASRDRWDTSTSSRRSSSSGACGTI